MKSSIIISNISEKLFMKASKNKQLKILTSKHCLSYNLHDEIVYVSNFNE